MIDSQELVTVVVPARDEEEFIGPCLESIRRQTYQHLQIIVVDGDSSDATADIVQRLAREDPRIELLRNPDRIIPRSLNLAAAAARSRWLVRVDAHCTVPPNYVEVATSHLATGRYGGVGGRKDGVGVTPAGRAVAVAMGSPFGVGNSVYHHGERLQLVDHIPFGCYPVDLVRRLGGWNEQLAVNQDFEFDQRVRRSGRDLLFDPRLRIDWHCRQSVPALFRQYRRYGKGKVAVMLLHPTAVRPRQLAPPALIAALVAATAVLPRRPVMSAMVVAPYVCYLATATVKEHVRLEDPEAKAWLPLVFASMQVGWGVGFWSGAAGRLRAALRTRQ